MTCHDARELFSALIDETLTREQRADVYGHLATCAECRRELAAIERTVALVRGGSPVRAPVGFVDRVVAAARPAPWYTRAARAALLPWPVKLPLGAAAVVLVAGLAVLMFRGIQEQHTASRYEATPPGLADRRVTETPAEAPAAPATASAPTPFGAPSSDRGGPASEADRPAGITSRVDQSEKRAEMEQRVESKTRDAAPAEQLGGAGAPAPARQPAPPATGETALAKREAAAYAFPDVIARLTAPDRDTAERALAALTTRLSGETTGRRVEGQTTVVDVTIPRDRYREFMREAGGLGDLRVESEPTVPPDRIRIAVHLSS